LAKSSLRGRKTTRSSIESEVHDEPEGDLGKPPRFFAVDFFCGAGGTTRGLIDADGYVIAGVDKETRCAKTFVENNPNETLDEAEPLYLQYDIFPKTDAYPDGQQAELEAKLDELIPLHRAKAKDAPLLFAICAPCQPFTTLARKELSAERKAKRERDSNLLSEAAIFVERFKPELVLSENVAGIKDPRYGGIWQEFRDRLEALGYVTGSRLVCTSKFGVPQYRKRSILIAVRRDLASPERFADLIGTELIVPDSDPDATIVTVADAIGHFPPLTAGDAHPVLANHKTRSLSELNQKRLAAALPGESNLYLETTTHGDLSLDCHRRVNTRLDDRCFTDVYTRMRPNRPSPTITTRCHSISNGRFGHYDVGQVRGISLREAAALQSFPDDYVFHPKDMIEPVARMIGNAVPPKLAKYFAGYLIDCVRADGAPREGPQADR
jgi:DNA (cytosine-5)-methyltransferase 1